eukprot:s1005_g18.t1
MDARAAMTYHLGNALLHLQYLPGHMPPGEAWRRWARADFDILRPKRGVQSMLVSLSWSQVKGWKLRGPLCWIPKLAVMPWAKSPRGGSSSGSCPRRDSPQKTIRTMILDDLYVTGFYGTLCAGWVQTLGLAFATWCSSLRLQLEFASIPMMPLVMPQNPRYFSPEEWKLWRDTGWANRRPIDVFHDYVRKFSRIRWDPANDIEIIETHARQAAEDMCRLSCMEISKAELFLKPELGTWWRIPGIMSGKDAIFIALNYVFDYFQDSGVSLAYDVSKTLANAVFWICRRLAAAHTEQVQRELANPHVCEQPWRLDRRSNLLHTIGSIEEEAMKLLIRFRNDCVEMAPALCYVGRQKIEVLNDCVEMAPALCYVGRQKIEVLAQLAQDLQEQIPQAECTVKDHLIDVMQRILGSAWQVVQGLVLVPSDRELAVLAVLLGIRSLCALPVLEPNYESRCSELRDLVLERIEQHVQDHARFPALGMRPTSTDLERFKKQAQLWGTAALASALPPSSTFVGLSQEETDDWLQRPEQECRSEVSRSWTICSASSSWTWDLVESRR